MISAADFPHEFPWMAERKPDPGVRVQIKANSDDNVEGREELARRVDAAVMPVENQGAAALRSGNFQNFSSR